VWKFGRRLLGRHLLCGTGHKNDGFCSADVMCTYSASTNDLDDNCQPPPGPDPPPPPPAPPAPPASSPSAVTATPSPPGGGPGNAVGQDCNMFQSCQAGLTCKVTEGWSVCLIPLWGKCKCV